MDDLTLSPAAPIFTLAEEEVHAQVHALVSRR